MKLFIFVFLLSGALASENGLIEKRIARIEENMQQNMQQIFGTLAEILHEIDGLKSNQAQTEKENSPAIAFEILNGPTRNDSDLEQRVQILEIQVSGVQEDVGILEDDQQIQNQRIVNVEDDVELVGSGLLTTQGNVAELDSRVVQLESQNGTGSDITEELAELDSRLDALELGGTFAFNVASSESYPIIPIDSVAVFDLVYVNLGEGYNVQTGEFTVPSGGAGLYYLYAHFLFDVDAFTFMNIRHNTRDLCAAYEDNRNSGDFGGASCGAVVQLEEGDMVYIFHNSGIDETPVRGNTFWSSFSGFRIAPA